MKKLHETVHPFIAYSILTVVTLAAAFCGMLVLISAFLFAADKMNLINADPVLPTGAIIGLIVSLLFIPFLEHILLQKQLFLSYGYTYAEAYRLTNHYVLPHTDELERYDDGGYSFIFRMSYTRDQIMSALDHMHRTHRVCYTFIAYNIPGTTCRARMAISKHTAEILVSEMQPEQSVVLETSLSGSGIISLNQDYDDLDNLHFISLADTIALKSAIEEANVRQISVSIGLKQKMVVDRRYLDLCQMILCGPQELIILPPEELA